MRWVCGISTGRIHVTVHSPKNLLLVSSNTIEVMSVVFFLDSQVPIAKGRDNGLVNMF